MNVKKKPSCAVPECTQKFDVHRYFFRFPKEHERWLLWVQACGRLDLEPKGPEYAYENCRLCHLHFEEKWYNINKIRARLHPDAVPTIFFGPNFKQQDNTNEMAQNKNEEESVLNEKIDRNYERIEGIEQIQEVNSNTTSDQIILSIVDNVTDIIKPSTSTRRSTIKSESPRKMKMQLKIKKLKAQNKTLRETIRRLRTEKKKHNTKEEGNECDILKKLSRKLLPENFNRILVA